MPPRIEKRLRQTVQASFLPFHLHPASLVGSLESDDKSPDGNLFGLHDLYLEKTVGFPVRDETEETAGLKIAGELDFEDMQRRGPRRGGVDIPPRHEKHRIEDRAVNLLGRKAQARRLLHGVPPGSESCMYFRNADMKMMMVPSSKIC